MLLRNLCGYDFYRYLIFYLLQTVLFWNKSNNITVLIIVLKHFFVYK